MKKILIILLSVLLIASFVFSACSKSEESENTTATTEEGLNSEDTEYGLETEEVTDENGETVTDENGDAVTTEVAVVYKKTEDGKYYAQKVDDDGNAVTDSDGNAVTIDSSYVDDLNNTDTTTTTTTSSRRTTTTTTEKATATTNKSADMTEQSDTTEFEGTETVPKTSASGTVVNFSTADQEIIANMLEVPYLYLESYENSDGVPIEIAAYTAVWMAQHDGGTASTYPSSPVVLNLFKYFGQTVVNFKTSVNKVEDSPITYNSSDDTFTVSEYPEKKQSVKISKIEDLGGNNFYKVTASVSGAGKIDKVVAIVQKNKLDTTLGFSIKALKWS